MLLLKALVLHIFWFLAVVQGPVIHDAYILVVTCVLLFSDYYFYKSKKDISLVSYFYLIAFFSLYGLSQDLILMKFNMMSFKEGHYPFWMNALYIVFIIYYGDVFNYIADKKIRVQALMGGLGGAVSYWAGVRLESLIIEDEMLVYFLGSVFMSWSILFPLSIDLFYHKRIWNKLLDMSLYYSFDLSGYLRHLEKFTDDYRFDSTKRALVTGGSSGIGLAVAKELASQNVETIITGRNQKKGEGAVEGQTHLEFTNIDMSDWDALGPLCDSLDNIDYLVLNAGGMPEKFEVNSYGVELQMASQLFGHYYLMRILKEKGKLNKGARVVWTSSGGMYLRSLSLPQIFKDDEYDKVSTYANVKRGQVSLLDYFRKEFSDSCVVGMHPGWVDTPGVRNSIAKFYEKMKGRLRNSAQGADTILWLLSETSKPSSGKFYFDRMKVKKNIFFFIRTKKEDVAQLRIIIEEYFKKIVF